MTKSEVHINKWFPVDQSAHLVLSIQYVHVTMQLAKEAENDFSARFVQMICVTSQITFDNQ